MNTEVWTEEGARCWSATVQEMRKHWLWARWLRRMSGLISVLLALLAAEYARRGWYWLSLIQMPSVWINYRLYLSNRRHEEFWRAAVHHGQRWLVENAERGRWHSRQLNRVFDEMLRK